MDPVNPNPKPTTKPDLDAFPLPTPAVEATPESIAPAPGSHFDPPAFHNPLATQQYDYAQQPVAETPPPEAPVVEVSDVSSAAGFEAIPPVTRLDVELPPDEPTAYTGPVPAPVRLAPAPRADDHHALAHQQAASQTPFSGQVAAQPGPPLPSPVVAPVQRGRIGQRAKWQLLAVVGGVGLLVVALMGWQFMGKRSAPRATTTPQASTAASVRSRDAQPLQGGNVKVETPCYVIQVPLNPTVNNNADCKIDLTYGEQKISSIIISTYRDTDLVSPTGSSSDDQPFDQKKFLEELITNTTVGRTVMQRESISVGGLPAEKVIIGEADKPATQVAYTYIVLPESDQRFNEKKFIAFIVTGAYGDAASQQGYNNALKWWYWK